MYTKIFEAFVLNHIFSRFINQNFYLFSTRFWQTIITFYICHFGLFSTNFWLTNIYIYTNSNQFCLKCIKIYTNLCTHLQVITYTTNVHINYTNLWKNIELYHELTPLLFDFVHLILCIKCTLEFLKVLHMKQKIFWINSNYLIIWDMCKYKNNS